MQSKRIIKIDSISSTKNRHYLIKAGNLNFLLNENSFSDNYYYVGKELNEDDLSLLKNEAMLTSSEDYAYSLINKKRYTRFELYKKLTNKGYNEQCVNNVLNKLEEYNLINDELYARDYKESKELTLYGEEVIINKLRYEKGIKDDIINKLIFVNEKNNAEKYIQSLSTKFSSYPEKKRKEKIKNCLIRRGFSFDIINDVLLDLEPIDNAKVHNKLINDLESAYRRYKNKYDGYELNRRIYSYLINKGYESDEIKKELRRKEDECE